jgi:hypothetical protein
MPEPSPAALPRKSRVRHSKAAMQKYLREVRELRAQGKGPEEAFRLVAYKYRKQGLKVATLRTRFHRREKQP